VLGRTRKELEHLLRSAVKRIRREKEFWARLLGAEIKEGGKEGSDLKEQLKRAMQKGLPVRIVGK